MNWQTIFRHLQEQGFDVYALGQHKGVCTSPYIVLRNNGTTLGRGAEQALYELLLYMPVDRMSGFEDFIREVKRAMNLLYPALKLVIPEDMYAQMRNNAIENDKLKRLRDSLLPKLMSGEVDVEKV